MGAEAAAAAAEMVVGAVAEVVAVAVVVVAEMVAAGAAAGDAMVVGVEAEAVAAVLVPVHPAKVFCAPMISFLHFCCGNINQIYIERMFYFIFFQVGKQPSAMIER